MPDAVAGVEMDADTDAELEAELNVPAESDSGEEEELAGSSCGVSNSWQVIGH